MNTVLLTSVAPRSGPTPGWSAPRRVRERGEARDRPGGSLLDANETEAGHLCCRFDRLTLFVIVGKT